MNRLTEFFRGPQEPPRRKGLRVRKLADRTADRLEDGSWPLAGLAFEGEPPEATRVSTGFVARGVTEGWLELANPRVVHRPGGPPDDEWAVTHTFTQADTVIFRCVGGDVYYRVVHQPDKYVDSDDDSEKVTPELYEAGLTRVDWFYDLELDR